MASGDPSGYEAGFTDGYDQGWAAGYLEGHSVAMFMSTRKGGKGQPVTGSSGGSANRWQPVKGSGCAGDFANKGQPVTGSGFAQGGEPGKGYSGKNPKKGGFVNGPGGFYYRAMDPPRLIHARRWVKARWVSDCSVWAPPGDYSEYKGLTHIKIWVVFVRLGREVGYLFWGGDALIGALESTKD